MAKKSNKVAKRSKLIPIMVLLAVLVAAAGGLRYWWVQTYTNPHQVFDRMLSQSLDVRGFGSRTFQSQGEQSLNQISENVTAPDHRITTINELGQGTPGSGTTIVTENLTTLDKSYVRYNSIKTDQKTASGKDFDFSQVIDKWGASPVEANQNSATQIYTQNVIVPFANLSAPDRKQLLEQIHKDNVYDVNHQATEFKKEGGRPVYIYDVTVEPQPYISMLKRFTGMLGLNTLDRVEPAIYKDVAPLKFKFKVDAWSGYLTQIEYVGATKSQQYFAHGGKWFFDVPKSTITLEELQNRLQSLQ